jgi:hypothetical protein
MAKNTSPFHLTDAQRKAKAMALGPVDPHAVGAIADIDTKDGVYKGEDVLPTLTISCDQLKQMLHLPDNCNIEDVWTTDYDNAVVIEYTDNRHL